MTDDEIKALQTELAELRVIADTTKENIRLGEIERAHYQEQIEQLSDDIVKAEEDRDSAVASYNAMLESERRSAEKVKELKESAKVWERKALAQERLHLQAVERVKTIKEGRKPIESLQAPQ